MTGCFFKTGIFGLVLLLLFPLAFSQLEITEIMYNPVGTDTNHEWIEVYNSGNESINVNSWNFLEGGEEQILTLYSGNSFILSNQYAIISANPETFLKDNPSYSGNLFDSTFTYGLSNAGEELGLSDKDGKNKNLFSYSPLWGGNGNGKTLSLLYQGFDLNSSWKEGEATPGKANLISSQNSLSLPPNLKLSWNAPEALYSDQKYANLLKISLEGKNDCSLKDKITLNYNYSNPFYFSSSSLDKEIGCSSTSGNGEFFFKEGGTYEICAEVKYNYTETSYADNYLCQKIEVEDISSVKCDLWLELEIVGLNETNIYHKDESIKISPKLNDKSYPYQIEYWIEDLFGNIVKEKMMTTNTNQKSWSIDIKEEDRVLKIKAQLYPACDDGNLENNYAEKMIIAVNKNFWQEQSNSAGFSGAKSNSSTIKISKITPETASFGKMVKAELEIYKGNTAKYSLSAWIEKEGKEISEKTKINLKSKYTTYELALPIQLDSNCDDKLKEGNAILVVEGLDQREEEKIKVSGINGALCKESKNAASGTASSDTPNLKFGYEISQFPSSVISGSLAEVKVLLHGDKQEHRVRVWSYIYRGSKCYSCSGEERESNAVEVLLPANEEKEVVLGMILDSEMEEGEYSVKIKINKDGQKTDYELTDKINVIVPKKESLKTAVEPFDELSDSQDKKQPPTYSMTAHFNSSGIVVYESSNEKAKQLAPWIVAVAFGIVCLVLIVKP